jgi:ATP-binding cassette subfamily B multidrug efflux pump
MSEQNINLKKAKTFFRPDEQDESSKSFKGPGEWKSLLFLFANSEGLRFKIVLALLTLLASSTLVIFSARTLGELVEYGLLPRDPGVAWNLAVRIVVLEGCAILLLWLGRRQLAKVSSLIILKLRAKLFDHLQILPMQFFDRTPQGRIITRVSHDVEGIEEFFIYAMGKVFVASFTGLIAMGVMIAHDPKIGLLISLGVLPGILFMIMTVKTVTRVNRRMSRSSSAVTAQLSEYISGIDVIRSHALEEWSMGGHQDVVEQQLGIHLEANNYFSWTRPLITFLLMLPLIGILWFGGMGVMAGTFTVGAYVAFLRYCERFLNPLIEISREIHVIQQALTNSERVVTFLQHETEREIFAKNFSSDRIELSHLRGQLAFEKVTMRYPTSKDNVLSDVSFTVAPGEKIGVVGRTGSGKTTILALLSRLYDYQEGQILIDGHELVKLDLHKLRQLVGVVSQDAIVFAGSVRENLCLERKFDDEVLIAMARKTGLMNVLARGGRSLDTALLEGGANLSAGEKQLLVVTRVLLLDPAIMVIDEATANVDAYHEDILHKAIFESMKNKTCLIVAHRLSTLQECDRLLVFSQGRLMEEGNHQELMKKQGLFYNLKASAGQSSLDGAPGQDQDEVAPSTFPS